MSGCSTQPGAGCGPGKSQTSGEPEGLEGGSMIVRRRVSRRGAEWAVFAAAILAAVALGAPAAVAQEEDKDKPKVEVYGFVQADYIHDFDRVDPLWTDTLRSSKIPTVDGLFGE